jgi:hypothetical protein
LSAKAESFALREQPAANIIAESPPFQDGEHVNEETATNDTMAYLQAKFRTVQHRTIDAGAQIDTLTAAYQQKYVLPHLHTMKLKRKSFIAHQCDR